MIVVVSQRCEHELGFVRCAVTGGGTAEKRLIEAGLAATHSSGPARLSSEPECELSTRVFFVQQINGSPHGGDCPEKVAVQLVARQHADPGLVIG